MIYDKQDHLSTIFQVFQITESQVFKRQNEILKRLEIFQQGEHKLCYRNYSYKKLSRINFQPLGVFKI